MFYYRETTDNKTFKQHAWPLFHPNTWISEVERLVLTCCSIEDWHEIYS
ncbi:hypothetical protein [Candidatus Hodgkinia cicadicola]